MTAARLQKPASVDALTPVERVLFCVPVLRTLLRWPPRNQRALRLERAVREQVAARAAFDDDAWGDDPLRRPVAMAVGTAIAQSNGLAQPHLHPDDPVDLLLFERDFLIGVEVRMGIEDALGRTFPDACYGDVARIGELVDRIVMHMR